MAGLGAENGAVSNQKAAVADNKIATEDFEVSKKPKDLRLRPEGMSLGVAVNRVTSGVISMTFISLYEAITISGTYFLFAGIAAVGWVFFYVFLPETSGKTLDEMECLFGKLVGSRKATKKMKEVNANGTSDGQIPLANVNY